MNISFETNNFITGEPLETGEAGQLLPLPPLNPALFMIYHTSRFVHAKICASQMLVQRESFGFSQQL